MIETVEELRLPGIGSHLDERKTRRTMMAQTTDDTLRALIRLSPPVRALREDLEKNIHLELYAGTGELAVRSFQGLQASVARITDDPYVATLILNVPGDAGDKEKVALARLAAGQLCAYLEGQTGLVGMGGDSGSINIQRAPVISMANINELPADALGRLVSKAAGTMESAEGAEE